MIVGGCGGFGWCGLGCVIWFVLVWFSGLLLWWWCGWLVLLAGSAGWFCWLVLGSWFCGFGVGVVGLVGSPCDGFCMVCVGIVVVGV
ncbi:hypothetical protein, partial [Cutibacterium acnes]